LFDDTNSLRDCSHVKHRRTAGDKGGIADEEQSTGELLETCRAIGDDDINFLLKARRSFNQLVFRQQHLDSHLWCRFGHPL